MGMEPINSIASIQAQTMTRPVQATKVNSETTDGNTNTNNVTVPKLDNNTLAVSKNQEGNNKQNQEREENAQASNERIKKAVENLNKNLNDVEAVFGVHEKTDRVTIKIVDKKTKETIKELPPEKTLDMIAKVWELAGLLVDEKR